MASRLPLSQSALVRNDNDAECAGSHIVPMPFGNDSDIRDDSETRVVRNSHPFTELDWKSTLRGAFGLRFCVKLHIVFAIQIQKQAGF
jgi:hypothetical protein